MTKLLLLALTVFSSTHYRLQCQRMEGATPYELEHLDDIKMAAGFGDAEHRGPAWYSMTSHESETSHRVDSSESTSFVTSESSESRHRSDTRSASSEESSEGRRATRAYRTCTPCAHDMLKKHTNLGIKWICGGYQRARRTFKSECMMRFRNCQDGTMFIKLSDSRCKNDTYHGRHWFYIYKV